MKKAFEFKRSTLQGQSNIPIEALKFQFKKYLCVVGR